MMIAALEGWLGRQVNILYGRKRAYTFATAIRNNDKFVGVIAIYVKLDELEDNWSLTKMPIIAVDKRGAIIMSNQPQLRLKALKEVSTKHDKYISLKQDIQNIEYIDYKRFLPQTGWELHVLANIAPIKIARVFLGGSAHS